MGNTAENDVRCRPGFPCRVQSGSCLLSIPSAEVGNSDVSTQWLLLRSRKAFRLIAVRTLLSTTSWDHPCGAGTGGAGPTHQRTKRDVATAEEVNIQAGLDERDVEDSGYGLLTIPRAISPANGRGRQLPGTRWEA